MNITKKTPEPGSDYTNQPLGSASELSGAPEPRAPQGITTSRCITTALRSLAALTALGLASQAVLAQGWYTVDDFQYTPGKSSVATGLAKDPTGSTIYSVGWAFDVSSVSHALAFKSSDGGTNWVGMDDYADPTSPPGSGAGPGYSGLAADPSGIIYASGDDSLASSTWFTRRSADGGLTWSVVDTLPFGMGLQAVATDAAGNVYVVGGVITNGGSGPFWIVRKGTGGTSWATVDRSGPNWTANGVFCHPTAGVFVVGQGLGAAVKSGSQTVYPRVWMVRRSQDGGASWATVDSFYIAQKNSVNSAVAYGAGCDSSGNVYVVGFANSADNVRSIGHWIVRRSTDGGNSWSTVDDFAVSGAVPSPTPRAFGCDANGDLFVAGGVTLGPGNGTSRASQQWLVRENLRGTGSWQTVDTFQYVSGWDSQADAVTCDSSGHTYIAGGGTDASGVYHWLVRKH